jgi:hypothetical protein
VHKRTCLLSKLRTFYFQDISQPVEITVTFGDLSAEAKEDFKEYVRQDKLVVSAIAKLDPLNGRAEVKQYGQRLGLESLKPFFKAVGDQVSVKELQGIFSGLEKVDQMCRMSHPSAFQTGRGARFIIYIYSDADRISLARPEGCVPSPVSDNSPELSGACFSPLLVDGQQLFEKATNLTFAVNEVNLQNPMVLLAFFVE